MSEKVSAYSTVSVEEALQKLLGELSIINEKTHPVGTKSWLHEIEIIQEFALDVLEKFSALKQQIKDKERELVKESIEFLGLVRVKDVLDLLDSPLSDDVLVIKRKQLQDQHDKLWIQVHNFSFDLQKEVSELIIKGEMNAWQLCFYLKGRLEAIDELLGLKEFEITETESAIEFRKKGWKPAECFEEK